jgi:aminoglycoside phosphotransferase (APT) family kinase protein
VIKLAPPGLPAIRNRDVLRQARLLRPLREATEVPVPEVLFVVAEGDGEPPAFAMSDVDGDSYEPIMDGPEGFPGADAVRSRAYHAASILACLHSQEPAALGVADEPVIAIADEVSRWARAFETVGDEFRSGADQLRDELLKDVPQPVAPSVIHGDFRLGNMLSKGGRVQAVIDWEIWSVSDPRIDLAWFLMLADRASQPLAVWQAPGMPSEDELRLAYSTERRMPVDRIEWFDALVRYKQAAISALVVKNNRRRASPDPAIERHAANPGPSIVDGLQRLGNVRRLNPVRSD